MRNLSYYLDSPLGACKANVIQVLKTCNGLAQNGMRVTLYAPVKEGLSFGQICNFYGVEQSVNIKKILYVPWLKFILNSLIMFFYLLKDKNEIIYSRNLYFIFLASFFGKRTFVYEAHQYGFGQIYHNYLQIILLKRLMLRKNFFLIVISDLLKQRFEARGIHYSMLVCHDGCDIISYEEKEEIEIERAGHVAVAMYAGLLKEFKGLGHIEYLAANNKDIKFYVIGDERNSCDRGIIKKLKTYENVCLTGCVEHADIYKYLKRADILLLLPTKKGVYSDVTSPLKLFEYMAAGKAILATDMSSLREVLRHNVNALIVPDDRKEIDKHFKILAKDEKLRDRLGVTARQDAKQYSWEERARKIKEYISTRD